MKPFLKWVGGKFGLINQIHAFYPKDLPLKDLNYAEPFLGGGAMFFYLSSITTIKSAILSDISFDLINCYICVKEEPFKLMEELDKLSIKYFEIEDKEAYFYDIRKAFNLKSYSNLVEAGAMFIFLNKTCFNGLFRMNSKKEFNTPFGFYKKPNFYDKENILSCSKALEIAELKVADFEEITPLPNSFIYLDPPYKPISKTASFNSYSGTVFNDEEQKRLARYIKKLSVNNLILLSNSSPEGDFFNDLYQGFYINKIKAPRNINSVGTKRGKVEELLISNYNNYVKRSMEFDF